MNFFGKKTSRHIPVCWKANSLVPLRFYNLSGSLVSSWVGKPEAIGPEADGVWRDDFDGIKKKHSLELTKSPRNTIQIGILWGFSQATPIESEKMVRFSIGIPRISRVFSTIFPGGELLVCEFPLPKMHAIVANEGVGGSMPILCFSLLGWSWHWLLYVVYISNQLEIAFQYDCLCFQS